MNYNSKYTIEDIKANYSAVLKCVSNDFPYQLDLSHSDIWDIFMEVHLDLERQHSQMRDKYFSRDGKGIIDLRFMDHYLVLCYRFAKLLSIHHKYNNIADAVYYSSRMRTGTDLYYRCEIGDYFLPSHTLGTVFDSHAKYGIGLYIHNNVHIGPYNIIGNEPNELVHPIIGDGVIIFAGASIFGKTIIGNNVTIGIGAKIINEVIPDNCIVLGASPNIMILPNKFENLNIVLK
jgi:serine acetyltransferase